MANPDDYSRKNTVADARSPTAIEGDTAMTGNWRDRTDTVFDCQKQPASGSRESILSIAA